MLSVSTDLGFACGDAIDGFVWPVNDVLNSVYVHIRSSVVQGDSANRKLAGWQQVLVGIEVVTCVVAEYNIGPFDCFVYLR